MEHALLQKTETNNLSFSQQLHEANSHCYMKLFLFEIQ